jgi:hypothetical protein
VLVVQSICGHVLVSISGRHGLILGSRMSVVGEVVQWARRWQLEHPCAQRRPCAPLEKEAIIDAIRCSAIMPFQVVWVVEGSAGDAVTLSHREFRKEADAAAFFEQLGDVAPLCLTP